MSSRIDRILHAGLYLLVFLLPLFWLPFSFEAWEFQKEFLLFFGALSCLVLWLAKKLFEKAEGGASSAPLQIRLLWPSDALVLIFLLVSTLSVFFSVDKYSSLFGFYGRFSGGLFGLISFVVVYFAVSRRVIHDTKYKILGTLLFSGFAAMVVAYLSLSGVLSGLAKLAPALAQRNFNPVAPSLEGLVVFLAPLIFLAFELGKRKEGETQEPKSVPFFNLLFIVLALGLLLIVDYHPSWIVLGLVSLCYLVFLLFKKLRGGQSISLKNYALLPFVFLVLAILGTNFDATRLFPKSLSGFPREVTLDQTTSWEIAGQALKAKPILGSGPATFFYDFSRFRPADFNRDQLWQVRFDRPVSSWAETLATLGLAGFLSFFLLAFWALRSKLSILNLRFSNLFFVLLAVVLAQAVYYQNAASGFVFWLFLGVIAGVMAEEKTFPLPHFSFDFDRLSGRIVLSFGALILGLAAIALVFGGFRIYAADFFYSRAFYQASGPSKTSLLQRAVVTNPFFAEYDIILARSLVNQAQKSLQEQQPVRAGQEIASAVEAGRRSVSVSPNWVAGWETLGLVYQATQGMAEGVENWGIKSFERALELEPTNPLLYSQLGKIHFSLNQMEPAKKRFLQARLLKPDYLEPRLFLALIREKEGDVEGAAISIAHLRELYPLDVDLAFQLGRLEFNQGKVDQAIARFKEVLRLNPLHLDGLYSLVLAYEKKGDKREALGYLQRALEIAPGNQTLIKKLAELKK